MTVEELFIWVVVMFPFSLLIFSALGIVSLNFHRLLYKVAYDEFYIFFHQLKFPLNIYKEYGVYVYVEKLNRITDFKYIRILRIILGIIGAILITINFVGLKNISTLQLLIILVLSAVQSAIFLSSITFGRNLNKVITQSDIN